MQALVLAAGMGRRLGALTQENTKCMVEVNGVRLIDRMLNQLSGLGLSRVVLVVGYQGQKLRDYIGDRYVDRLRIEYVENPVYDTTNNIYSLYLAKSQLQEEDTILLESDLIFDDALLQLVVETAYPDVALVSKYETWMDGTMVRLDGEGNIVNFIPKKDFSYSEVDTYYKTVNIYRFSKEFSRRVYVPFLEAYSTSLGMNEYYEQVLRIIILLERHGIKALPVGSLPWYEIDDVQDLDIAEVIFAPDSEKLSRYAARYGGFWRFPRLLDFCYLVNPFFPTEKMRDELRANFDALLTQYPSGMGVNRLLASKYFGIRREYMAVGNGAAEIMLALMQQLTGRIGVVLPTFEEYPNRCEEDRLVAYVPGNPDFRYGVDDLKTFFSGKGIETLLLINPDNPSGNYIFRAEVLGLATWCAAQGIRLVVDESFVDFSEGYAGNSLLYDDLLEAHANLVVVKSISKSYGVPGLRLGVLATSDTALLSALLSALSIWNINSFAEFYMQIFNKYEGAYARACDLFLAERARFRQRLEQIPYLRVIPSQANYLLCEVLGDKGSRALAEELLNTADILIKDCSAKKGFDGRSYVRLAVRGREDNDALVAALEKLGQ